MGRARHRFRDFAYRGIVDARRNIDHRLWCDPDDETIGRAKMDNKLEAKEEIFRLWATIGAILIIVGTFFPYRGGSEDRIWRFWKDGYLMARLTRIIVIVVCLIALIYIRKLQKKALANTMLGFGGLSVLYTLGHGLGVLNFQWGFDGLDAAPGIITEKSETLLLGFWMMLLGSMAILAAGNFAFRLNAKREKEIDD